MLLALGALAPGSAHAQDTPPPAEPAPQAQDADAVDVQELAGMDLEQLLGVVVVASGKDENLFQAPAAVSVLSRDEIRARAATSVPDLLRTVPGVQVARVAPGNYVVTLRGTGGLYGNNVIVVVDGVPMNNPVDSNIDWANLPVDVESIERIEVARGPVSPIFGANAYTGVIRIDTVQGGQDVAPVFQVGARGGVDQAAHGAGTLHGHVQGRTGRVSYGFRAHGTYDDTLTESKGEDQAALQNGALGGRVAADVSEHGKLSVDFGTSVASASATDSLVLKPGAHRTTLTYGRAGFLLTDLTRRLASVELWSHVRALQRDSHHTDFENFHYEDTRSFQSSSGLDLELALPANFRLALGSDINLINARTPFLYPEENGRLRFGAGFRANGRIDLFEHLLLSAAARLDVSPFVYELPFSFRASAIYYQSNLSVRLTVGSAYRNPSYVEAGSQFVDESDGTITLEGEAHLKVPRFEAVELGLTTALLESLTVQLTSYIARARDLLEGDFEQVVRRTYRNSGLDTEMIGIEAELGYQLRKDLRLSLDASALFFLQENDDPDATIGAADQNSRFIGGAGVRWTPLEGRVLLAGTVLYTSKREYTIAAGIPPQILTGETLDNARIELVGGYEPWRSLPLGLRLSVATTAPSGVIESALPNAAQLGTQVMASVVYRNR